MKINAAYYTAQGARERNEDNLSLLEDSWGVIAAVADGLGGEGDGHLASLAAIKSVNDCLTGARVTTQQVKDAIVQANQNIVQLQGNGKKMKSTLALLYLDEAQAISGSVGDTRIYQFRNNEIEFQSTDHSVAQMSVSVGEIDHYQIRSHLDRNKLTRALGSRSTVSPDLQVHTYRQADAFLLCTDGFWENIWEDEMIQDLAGSLDAEQWLEKMRRRVENKLGPVSDNHSALAIIIKD